MTDYGSLEQRLSEALGLARRAVAVAFQGPPPGCPNLLEPCPPGAASGGSPPKGGPSTPLPVTTTTARLEATSITFPLPRGSRPGTRSDAFPHDRCSATSRSRRFLASTACPRHRAW